MRATFCNAAFAPVVANPSGSHSRAGYAKRPRRVRRGRQLVVYRRVVLFCRGGARKMREVRPMLFGGGSVGVSLKSGCGGG